MGNTLYIFPDTNLFIQCRPLEELDWAEWSAYAEVKLVITRPVQREIDAQKNRGNARVGQRARKTAALFREIILGEGVYILREKSPRVSVHVRLELAYADELQGKLDYSLPDDQIVGITAAFIRDNPADDSLVLTHDTGPIALAKMTDTPFHVISEGWLLQPERTEMEKEINQLKQELSRLQKAEPKPLLKCCNQSGYEVDKIDAVYQIAIPLSGDEIAETIECLKSKIPTKERILSNEDYIKNLEAKYVATLGLVYVPPSEDEIADFFKRCEEWLTKCHEFLLGFHTLQLMSYPTFCFSAINEGSRPAQDVLVTIEARGDFEIFPQERANATKGSDVPTKWPSPPSLPSGRFENRLLGRVPLPLVGIEREDRWSGLSDIMSLREKRRDPNAFYWKPSRPIASCLRMNLECEQWRHGVEAEEFMGVIFFSSDYRDVRGVIECTIHAANMADVVSCRVPVHVTMSHVSVLERVHLWMEQLVFKRDTD